MVKFGKNKFKALNKIAKKQNLVSTSPATSNKVLKKKINADKKVTFQKEVLFKESLAPGNELAINVSAKDVILKNLSKKAEKKSQPKPGGETTKPKQKPVEKHKKRQKTAINDTKLLLSLMKKNKS